MPASARSASWVSVFVISVLVGTVFCVASADDTETVPVSEVSGSGSASEDDDAVDTETGDTDTDGSKAVPDEKTDTEPSDAETATAEAQTETEDMPPANSVKTSATDAVPESATGSEAALTGAKAATTASPNQESPAAKAPTPPERNADSPIIISEIQTKGGAADDDFVELSNSKDAPVSLKGFELRRKTKGDTTERGSLFHSFSDTDSVPPGGYLLWANKEGSAAFVALADVTSPSKTSPALTDDNSLALFDPDNNMVASVTWGSGHTDPFSESDGGNPGKNESLTYDRDSEAWSLSKRPTPTNSEGRTIDPDPLPAPLPPLGTVMLNELLPDPETGNEEWIELRNTGDADIDLVGWMLRDASGTTYEFPKRSSFQAGGLLVIGGTTSGIALNNSGKETLLLLFPDETTAHSFEYAKTEKGASYAWDGHSFRLTHTPTPGEGNVFDPEPAAFPLPPVGTIRLNELFPNPKEKGEANEWIELRNAGPEPVSLLGWTLRSGAGKFTWTEKIPTEQREIPAGGFLVLPRSLTRLALRNTDGTVTLMAPDGAIIDTVAYGKTTEGASYGLTDSGRFRFSKTLTPGTDNVFGTEPKAKRSSIPKRGYRGVLIPFSVSGNKKGMKYVWDFGDGHRSYLAETGHRFTKAGTYRGTLTLRDGIEEYVKPFTIRIGKYPNRDIHLTELCPNPTRRDTDTEWIRVRNDDTKRIDLSGWIIASATDKAKLVNHVILTDRSIDPGEEIVLTRADSRFTLPNERAVIELRRPDGKTVQTVEYLLETAAKDDAVYADTGNGWSWILPSKTPESADTGGSGMSGTEKPETDPFLSGMTRDPDTGRLSFGAFIALGTPYDPVLPDSLPRVLGTSDERLTSEGSTSESFLDTLFRILNGLAAGTQST